jgi:hypothetical protein
MLLTLITAWWVQAKPPKETSDSLTLQEMNWLAGRWQDTNPSDFTDEHWAQPVGGAMVGMCRLGSEADKALYEILLIEEKDGKLIYTMEHFGSGLAHRDKAPLVFDVHRGKGEKEVVFVQRDSPTSTRLIYRLASRDRLEVTLAKQRDGKEVKRQFELRRAEIN